MTPLVERDDELTLADSVLARALAGEGRLLVVKGLPGTGKTALINEFVSRAKHSGFELLRARGVAIETDFAFGLASQLLDVHLGDQVTSLLTASSTGPASSTSLHQMFQVVANLAARQPVLAVADDVHWADEPSLRFLRHLAARIRTRPIVLIVSWRAGFDRDRQDLRSLLVESDAAIHVRSLSRTAVTEVVRSQLDDVVDPVVEACAAVTGGNPFLLSELLAELRQIGLGKHLSTATVGQTVPARIAASTLINAASVHPRGPDLLRAIAVLDEPAQLTQCAQLIGMSLADADEIANCLAEQGVLVIGDRVAIAHPIVRTAILEDLTTHQRASIHTTAARLLSNEHESPSTIARHLLATQTSADPELVWLLRETARQVGRSGATDTAIALLQRALGSVARASDRAEVLLELGTAEYEAGRDSAPQQFRAVIDGADDQLIRARGLIALASATWADAATQRENIDRYEQGSRDVRVQDGDLALELDAVRLAALLANPDLEPRFTDEAERYRDDATKTRAGRMMRSFVARSDLLAGRIDAAAEQAEASACDPGFIGGGGHPLWRINVIHCLIAAQRFDVAECLLAQAISESRSPSPSFVIASWLRALTRHRKGDLRGAEEDARNALSAKRKGRPPCGELLLAALVLIEVLIEQGRSDEAEELIEEYQIGVHQPCSLTTAAVLTVRGRARAAAGRLNEARADFEAALRRTADTRGWELSESDARPDLCLVHRAAGRDQAAREAVDEMLTDALDAGGYRAAIALRVAGIVRGGLDGLDLLQQSVHALSDSSMQLERAKSLADYGAALRRAGQLGVARECLREAMQLSTRLGASAVARRASDELRASGFRYRKVAFGTGSLTASEMRVAQLASTGLSNKEIAKSLFVSVRTVELHLSNTFSKLEIRSRHDIAAALAS